MRANYHTHTWRCNHAEGTEEQYVRAAMERGLEVLGFSDHAPYIFDGDYYSHFRMRLDQLDGYVSTVLALREKYRGKLEIPLGLEVEYYPGLLPRLLPVLRDRPMDYLILGQHFLGNEEGEPYSGSETRDEGILARYCDQVIEAMETGLFSCFAHPDLINFRGPRQVYKSHMRRICKAAKSCGIPLEINLLGLETRRHYPNPAFWALAAEEGCRGILGCDAHRPRSLSDTKWEKKALKMAESFGLEILKGLELRKI